ncbi:MAG: hypothetical protein VX032_05025, partial [SAR324 cluster bacterium]|nr:hypothetical protein [SAR324 cluster bacterium]
MQITSFSRSKYRDFDALGDDITLLLPGLYGVFDGATDPTKTIIDGITSGRFAAVTCAQSVCQLWSEKKLSPIDELLHQVNAELEKALLLKIAEGQLRAEGKPPSTTMALAWEIGEEFGFFLIGDSGVRINGQEEIVLRKQIDTVSTQARNSVYRMLRDRGLSGDELEYQTRQLIYYGLDKAVQEDVLQNSEVERILEQTRKTFGNAASEGVKFLQQGVVSQHRFANHGDLPLGYASLNGKPLAGEGMLFFSRPRSAVQSIELFTDGYFSLPSEIDLAAWEAEFQRVEEVDSHKIDRFPAIKGSTSSEFSDDRSVVIVRYS